MNKGINRKITIQTIATLPVNQKNILHDFPSNSLKVSTWTIFCWLRFIKSCWFSKRNQYSSFTSTCIV